MVMEKKFDSNVGFGIVGGVVCKRADVESKLEALNTQVLLGTSMGNDDVLQKLKVHYNSNLNHLPTGIDFVDDLTFGGLYSGLTVLAGVPNVGKTSLLVQIAAECSKRGVPVVFVSKDMRSEEIMLKVISYIASNLEGADALGINEITDLYAQGKDISDNVREAVRLACQNLHIVDFNSGVWDSIDDCSLVESSNMGKIVELYSKLYKSAPIFIVDSLQSVSISYEKSSKEGVDVALAELKRLERKFDARMIVVSNLNRLAYGKPIEITSLKESGNIEFEASCILGMEIAGSSVNLNDFRNGKVRRVKIKNLKDRAGGYREAVVEFDVLRSTFSTIQKHTPTPVKSGKGRSSDKGASGGIKAVKDDGGFMDKFDKPLDNLALEALEMLKKA